MLHLTRQTKRMCFAEFLDRASAPAGLDEDLLFLYSEPLAEGGALSALRADVDTYPFHADFRDAIGATYPRNNVFFYRSSLTDWHYHHTAEALLTQVVGVKEVIMLPPSLSVCSYMFALQSERLHLFDCELGQSAAARLVTPLRSVLAPGDALYIPSFWWHLVSTRGHRALGATVPTWWRTPLHVQCDMRFPANREAMRALIAGRAPRSQAAVAIPALLGGALFGRLRRLLRPDVIHHG
jgi:hypothetical protein